MDKANVLNMLTKLTKTRHVSSCSVKTTRQMVRQIFAERGIRGLWRGWMPNVQRAALVNLGGEPTFLVDTVWNADSFFVLYNIFTDKIYVIKFGVCSMILL